MSRNHMYNHSQTVKKIELIHKILKLVYNASCIIGGCKLNYNYIYSRSNIYQETLAWVEEKG